MNPEIEFYQAQGLSLFPLPHGQKKDDTFKWKAYQERRPTKAEIQKWFGNGAKHNIAVVCGKVSGGLVVLDCDSEDRFWELAGVIRDKAGVDVLTFTRVSQTGKGYHIWLIVEEPVSSAKFPKLDIKAEGGYILGPPSLHPEGREYKWVNDTPIHRITRLEDIGINLKQKRSGKDEHTDNWVTEALKGIGEGGRNDTCYRLASYFRNKHPQDITEKLLLDWNQKNSPPLGVDEILRTINSAYGRITNEGYKDSITYLPETEGADTERYKNVTESVTKSRAEVETARRELDRAEARNEARPTRDSERMVERARAEVKRAERARDEAIRRERDTVTRINREIRREERPRIEPRLEQSRLERPRLDTQQRIERGRLERTDLERVGGRGQLIRKSAKGKEKPPWTAEEIKSAIAFRMGMLKRKGKLAPVTIARKEPYTPGDEEYFIGKTPPGMKVLSPTSASAKKTIQLLGGRYPGTITGNIGFARYRVQGVTKHPGQAQMSFGTGPSVKRGPQYYTKTKGGVMISRRPLGRRKRR